MCLKKRITPLFWFQTGSTRLLVTRGVRLSGGIVVSYKVRVRHRSPFNGFGMLSTRRKVGFSPPRDDYIKSFAFAEFPLQHVLSYS